MKQTKSVSFQPIRNLLALRIDCLRQVASSRFGHIETDDVIHVGMLHLALTLEVLFFSRGKELLWDIEGVG